MKTPTIVIDLDNTILNTAERKQKLLATTLNMPIEQIDIQKIKNDYYLHSFLGRDTAVSRSFFEQLDAPDVVRKYSASIFPNTRETIDKMHKKGYSIVVITGRPGHLKDATVEEIKEAGLDSMIASILMMPAKDDQKQYNENDSHKFKLEQLKMLSESANIFAVIGDRPEDIEVACDINAPAILLRSTISDEEMVVLRNKIKRTRKDSDVGDRSKSIDLTCCQSWLDIYSALDQLEDGRKKMEELRMVFIDQYARWLSDLDNKSRLSVTMATALSALSGKLLYDELNGVNGGSSLSLLSWEFNISFLLLVTVVTSILSMIFSIQAYTSRQTSGSLTARQVQTKIKQFVAILIGKPEDWKYREDDAIDDFKKFHDSSEHEQSQALMSFFRKYKTYNAEVLLNRRLYELRAANWSKVYPERMAAQFLILSILSIIAWLLVKFILKI